MKRLDGLLSASALERPTATAVIDAERDRLISYADLDQCSTRIRDLLVAAGVQPGDRVGICIPKSIESVAALFGILKANAAYVPVDVGAPMSRNAFIYEDCSVRAILADEALASDLAAALSVPTSWRAVPPELSGSHTNLHLIVPAAEVKQPPVEDLAYILYTSGSTGKPKGVMHTHSSALSFIDWCSDTFEPTADDRFSSHAPFHFDLSILDIYVPLKHGATLVLIGEDLGKQPMRLAEVIAQQHISMWYSTPSILRLLVEFGRLDVHDCPSLRIVNFAGEVFPVKHLRAVMKAWPHPRYFNLYGPTETNVCTFYEVPSSFPDDRTDPFPIGVCCSNDRCLVFDDGPVPPGEEGELLVTGGTVMQGYWNQPERTARAFYVDPDGTRWYRTGDVVREGEDGNFIFLGRRDRMVKRRGYRIELGEIEAAMYRHPSVREAAVVAIPDEENGVIIKAFLTWAADESPSIIRLKRFAAENLPLYMIPDQFSFQTSLPKTSTDKVDYQTLMQIA